MISGQSTKQAGRLMLISHEFSPFRGGVATYCQELATALHRAGCPVEVWAPDYGKSASDGRFLFPMVRLRCGGSLRFPHMLGMIREVYRRRQQLQDATVLLGSVGAHIAFFFLRLLGRPRCRKLIGLLHGSEVLRFERNILWRILARRLFSSVDDVLAVSNFTKSLVERSFLCSAVANVQVVPCAGSSAAKMIAAVTESATTVSADSKIRILTLARVHPRKGQLDTVRALALLPSSLREKVVYQMGGVGDAGYLEKALQACRAAGVECVHLGEVAADKIASIYAQCDIYAMTSRTLSTSVEGFGIGYLEAGYHGKPVVGYRCGGVPEAVVEGETGLLVDEGDTRALSAAFEELITSRELRQKLGDGGRRHAAKFSWDRAARIILDLVARKP